jgi:hypothetical protein
MQQHSEEDAASGSDSSRVQRMIGVRRTEFVVDLRPFTRVLFDFSDQRVFRMTVLTRQGGRATEAGTLLRLVVQSLVENDREGVAQYVRCSLLCSACACALLGSDPPPTHQLCQRQRLFAVRELPSDSDGRAQKLGATLQLLSMQWVRMHEECSRPFDRANVRLLCTVRPDERVVGFMACPSAREVGLRRFDLFLSHRGPTEKWLMR